MLPKQENYSVGIYMRLSKDDERAGESLSIENQRTILTRYVNEQKWTIYDEYIDDGISGVTFERPGVQRLLEDAKSGKINLIICKDLSRFGRNYIMVGQYTDYLFPMYGIRFIALNDNIDTAKADNASMDMMPIMNVFNEWFAANTSKKLRAVVEANARAGKYRAKSPAFGYLKADNDKGTPIIDPNAAPIVQRIFIMRSKGISPRRIATSLNDDNILTPSAYLYQRLGRPDPNNFTHVWGEANVNYILKNPIYLGKLAQRRSTTVSYKNHKIIKRDESDWIVIENNHEPIISQELWDKVREVEASVSHGKCNKAGELVPLSGLLYCDSCGYKMKQVRVKGGKGKIESSFTCGYHARYGKKYCTTHAIRMKELEEIIKADIRDKLDLVIDEDMARRNFLDKRMGCLKAQNASDMKRKNELENRIAELDHLTESIYEDKVHGKVPEDVCMKLIEKYQTECKNLQAELYAVQTRLDAVRQDEADVEEFIRRLKKYANFDVFTREMALDLIEYATVDEHPKDKKAQRTIHIYYKFLDKPPINKRGCIPIDKN